MYLYLYGDCPEVCLQHHNMMHYDRIDLEQGLTEILWDQVTELTVFGTTADHKIPSIWEPLPAGVYVPHNSGKSATDVMILGVQGSQTREYLACCSSALKKLTICFLDHGGMDVGSLTNLRYLALNDTPLCTGLDKLEQLFQLSLYHLPVTTLAGLTLPRNLHSLYLMDTPVTILGGMELPEKLELLNLSGSSLTGLDDVLLPKGLKKLLLKGTPMRRLPDQISRLKHLELLDLSDMKLAQLPDWLPELGLEFSFGLAGEDICLHNTTVDGVDMSIFHQNREMIRQWFEQERWKREYLFLSYAAHDLGHYTIGLGGTGKSTFVTERLQRMLPDQEKRSQWWLDLLLERKPRVPQTPWEMRRLELLKPLDRNAYYSDLVYSDTLCRGRLNQEVQLVWSRRRYTPPGGFLNEDWDPKTYRRAYEAHEPLCLLPDTPAREESANPLRELKIVFLGDGEAGKSHTIARLLRDGEQAKDFPGVSTPGIVIDDKTYNIGGREIKVHFWDFGGQEILHSMHRMFLTERTLYVVVLNVREGNQQERARYWLHNLRSFANGAPVLLVLNKMDMNRNASVNESDLRAMYPGLTEVVKMSALTDTKAQFESGLLAALRRQIGGFEYLESPFLPAWSRLKDALQGMQTSYIRGAQFRQFCDKCGVTGSDDVRRGLLNWFSDLGVSFCYSDSRELEDYVVLRPDWITNAIYLLLFNKVHEITNGLVTHDTIYEMLRSPDNARTLPGAAYTRDEVEYVLNVFRKFRLSFRVEEGVEFLPMLCDANSAPAAEEYAADPGALEFRMLYEYLPNNVLHRLMVERRRDLDLQNVWLTGARFVYGKTGLSAVVKSEGDLLRILVRAGESAYEPQRYLDLLKGDLERINEIMGLTVAGTEMVYKHDGLAEAFDYDQLMSFLDAGLTHMASKKTKRPVPIREILKQSDYPEDENQKKLIEDVRRACEKLQGNKKFWNSLEDERTDYVRDLLQMTERYTVLDQHRGGVSAGGERAGSLDLDIRLEANACWTVLEALNLKSSIPSQIRYWDAHLDKLLDNYNPEGRSFLFHVSYVGCPKTDFNKICSDLYDHLRWYSPESFEVIPRTAREVPLAQSPEHQHRFMRMFKCVYDCGGAPMTVYHYFVRIGGDIP